jgi:protein-S-isoprenylcysteine O-methyltransferase Ste14
VIAISITASVFVAQNFRVAGLPHGRVLAIAAVILFVAGLILRWWAIITLGRFFTVNVTIEKNHELVERGPFRVVRHPSYTGVLLAFVGLGLSFCNWAALLVILLPIGAAFIHRMNVEEGALLSALGPRYAEYMTRTKRLVPFVYWDARNFLSSWFESLAVALHPLQPDPFVLLKWIVWSSLADAFAAGHDTWWRVHRMSWATVIVSIAGGVPVRRTSRGDPCRVKI